MFPRRNLHRVRRCATVAARQALWVACAGSLLDSWMRSQRGLPFLTRTVTENATWLLVFLAAFAVALNAELRSR